jgi:ferric-dicitrate binding protein FerR (iron transport regulator)
VALTAAARTQLGPDALALSSKVVEGAFVRAWDARTRFQTPEQVHQFLVEDIQHAAARALSRRAAAHRLGGAQSSHVDHHAPAAERADPEQSWAHIVHALHGEVHSPKALAEAAAISRHEAAEHIQGVAKERSWWLALGFGAAALGLAVGLVLWIDHLGAPAKVAAAVNAADARVVTSLPAQIGVVTLDDGTKVRIAPESKLSIPKTFGPELRAVKLDGAATFDVAAGQKRQFQVHARNAVVTAKGTAFVVRAYIGDPGVTVAVTKGLVTVQRGNQARDVAAGEGYLVPDSAVVRAASPAEREEAEGWIAGTVAVANRPLRDVLPELRRWYGLTVLVPQTTLLDRPVTFRASLDSSRQAIHGIERSTGLEFGYNGPNMVFREREAKAGAKAGAKVGGKAKARRR